MKTRQSGFTLVEIAIVLVIIGLLLGGVLKGQELINSAKVKNLAQDFRTVPLFIYGYQDKFRALPGDDAQASTHVCPSEDNACTTNGVGDGKIDGTWDDEAGDTTPETVLFWQHLRLANLASGPTQTTDAGFLPRNAEGGRIGVQSAGKDAAFGVRGSYAMCSAGIQGKYIRQLDTTLDDGDPTSGSMRAGTGSGDKLTVIDKDNPLDDNTVYVACLGF